MQEGIIFTYKRSAEFEKILRRYKRMKYNNETPAGKEALKLAATENKFGAQDLTGELLPLIESYFIGSFARDGKEIRLNFLNGQRFLLSIREVN